jgi:hypothetical protein
MADELDGEGVYGQRSVGEAFTRHVSHTGQGLDAPLQTATGPPRHALTLPASGAMEFLTHGLPQFPEGKGFGQEPDGPPPHGWRR